MKKFFSEFKTFIMRGNVIDMAVGVIIAGAFGKITTSLVNDVLMPAIGMLIGGIDLSRLNITLAEAQVNELGEVTKEAVVIGIGTLLVTIIDFLIVAFVVFLIIKGMNRAQKAIEERKKKEEAPEEPAEPEPSAEEKLLMEIRDLLKEKK